MIPRLPYGWLAAALALAITHGMAYVQGRHDGAAREATRWQQTLQREQREQQAARAQWVARLEEINARRQRAEQEAADAIAQIRIEHAPGRVEVRREVVERAVYRDCVVSDRVRDILAAALAGRPVPGADPVGAGGGVVPGRAAGAQG